MNINVVPGGQDFILKMEDALVVSTSQHGTPFDITAHGLQVGTGIASGVGMPLNVVCNISALTQSAGANTTLVIIESDDYDGTNFTTGTWTVCSPLVTITSGGSVSGLTLAAGSVCVPAIVSKKWVSGSLTVTASTLTLTSYLTPKGFAGSR